MSYGVGFYISSSPSNIAHTITNIKSHYSLEVFHLLHFSFASPSFDSAHKLPASDPFISGFNVLIFSHKHIPMSTIWCPQPLITITEPECYLHYISIPSMKQELIHTAPSFLTAHSSDQFPLHNSLYSYLLQSLDLPNPSLPFLPSQPPLPPSL